MLDEPQGGPSKRPQTTTNGTTTTNCATDARRARISTKPLPHVERSPSRAGGKGAKACLGSSTGQTAHDLTGLKLAQPELLHEVLLGQGVQEGAVDAIGPKRLANVTETQATQICHDVVDAPSLTPGLPGWRVITMSRHRPLRQDTRLPAAGLFQLRAWWRLQLWRRPRLTCGAEQELSKAMSAVNMLPLPRSGPFALLKGDVGVLDGVGWGWTLPEHGPARPGPA